MTPTRLYRVTNRGRRGLWVFALDEQDATSQAFRIGHIKSRSGALRVEDQTQSRLDSDEREGLRDTLEITREGLRGPATRSIPVISGQDLIDSLKSGGPGRVGGRPGWIRDALT